MSRPISDIWFHRVKSSTRDLVKLCGGVIRAGEIADVSKSEVSRWQSATSDDIISLPAALALETECGVPLVTTAMAELNGRRLSDPRESEVNTCLLGAYTDVASGLSEYLKAMSGALADGKLTPAEAEVVDRSLVGCEAAIAQLRLVLARIKAEGGATLRVVS